jgi:hypothetical protein
MSDSEMENLKDSLVNAKKFSDVIFTFPTTSDQSIFGHKAILSSNCIVFAKMFSGAFAVEKKIQIVDIKHEVFLELIKYIYTGALDLTKTNMAELLYAGQKYLLKDLKIKAEKFVLDNTNYVNLLEIMNASNSFENPAIATKCCELFCDNPLHFLNNEQFLNLSAKALKMVMDQQKMNCTELQLKEFALKWLNKNYNLRGSEFREATYRKLLKSTGVERWQLGPKSLFNIETIFNYGKFDFLPFTSNEFSIRNEKKFSIYGIGLYSGVFQDKEETVTAYDKQTYFDETIYIRLFQYERDS